MTQVRQAAVRRPAVRLLLAATLAPVLLASMVAVGFAALESAGVTPLSYAPPANVAEAAGMGLGSEVLRFLREGDDPAAVYDVRADIISPNVRRATALEAAIWSRRVQLVRMLDREGAIPADSRAALACLATALRTSAIVDYLASGAPLHGCDPEATYRSIEARGR